jgi:cytochrome c biogenesis protein CcmG, thiol:disulfide interchange protein DsbE
MRESADAVTQPAASGGFRWIGWVAVGGVVLLLVVLAWALFKPDRPGSQAPDFTLTLFDGYGYEGQQEVTLSDLQGQVVVINFWAEWCVECKLEAELLEATWRAYRDRGVVFVGVNWVDVETEARKYLTRYDITYPNGPDLGGRIGQRYGLTGVPETFFIDKTGAMDYYKLGALSANELTKRLDTLLAQP